jgi:hypothetical protein
MPAARGQRARVDIELIAECAGIWAPGPAKTAPEVVNLPPGAGRWRAVVTAGPIPADGTRTTHGARDLYDLMNQPGTICPPDGNGCTAL